MDQAGRMGRSEGKTNYAFDTGIYVELDDKFEVWEIWELEKSKVKELEERRLSYNAPRGRVVRGGGCNLTASSPMGD